MLRCIKCDSLAVMPKSGLCLSCDFVNPIVEDVEQVSETQKQLDNSYTSSKAYRDKSLISDDFALDEGQKEKNISTSDLIESGFSESENTALIKSEYQEDETVKHKSTISLDKEGEGSLGTINDSTNEKGSDQTKEVNTEDVSFGVQGSDDRWYDLAPTFQQVKSKAPLISSHVKIINSFGQNLEKLKGNLISGEAGIAHSYMLSSAYKGEGVTVSALAMGVALSRFGNSRVLLVDANALDPSLHELFSLTKCPGLIEYVTETDVELIKNKKINNIHQEMQLSPSDRRYSWAQYVYYTEYRGLYVMPYAAEKVPSSLWDVVENKIFQSHLEQLKQNFDYIVFDTSAILSSSEPGLLSQYVDGVILIIEAEKTKWEVAELAVETIRNSGGVFVGSVLNKRKFYIPKSLYRWI